MSNLFESEKFIPYLILSAIVDADKCDFEICKYIENFSNGKLIFSQPSLYSFLRNIEAKSLLSSYWKDNEIDGRKHYYSITEQGREFLHNQDMSEIDNFIDNLLLEQSNCAIKKSDDKKNIAVVSQENLFNLAKNNDVKVINEDTTSQENNSFFQFDFFGQDIKSLNKVSSDKEIVIDEYSNKYADMDRSDTDIEPILREDVFSKKNNELSLDHDNPLNNEHNSKQNNRTLSDSLVENNFEDATTDGLFENSESLSLDKDKIAQKIENDAKFDDNEKILQQDNVSPSLEQPDIMQQNDSTQNIEVVDSIHSFDINTDDVDKASNFDINTDNTTQSPGFEDEERGEIVEIDSNDKKINWDEQSNEDLPIESVDNSNDYKMIIGQLYNNSQLPDPYEENKYFTFKELFPTSRVQQNKKKREATTIDILISNTNENSQNLELLSKQFENQGLKLKRHDPLQNKNNRHSYTDINRLNMVNSWIISFIMIMEMLFCYFILKNSEKLVASQTMVYSLGLSFSMCFCIIFTLENFFDRYKLVEVKSNFKNDITKRLLIFITICIVVFAICLVCGMQNLLENNFLSYWLVPILIASNLLTYSISYHALLKTKSFNN